MYSNQTTHDPLEYFEEEMSWVRQQKHFDCGLEMIKHMTYEEAKSLLEPRISQLYRQRAKSNRQYKKLCRSVLKRSVEYIDDAKIVIDLLWCLSGMGEDIKNNNRLDELLKYWKVNEYKKTDRSSPKCDRNLLLERAKTVPIEQLYEGTLRNSGFRLSGLCPFHDERTPSFYIFPETNTYHCFGCSAHGDSISFYMKLNSCDFNQALAVLGEK